ncbi:hypothetical protein GCM10010510_63120 [Streptomyces anandii JCM 4720]|nr:hypothetical protein GCM10010510_63120 [Streptomyces anandii JCM 4720]
MTAVTMCPSAIACSVACRPVGPFAPNITSFTRLPLSLDGRLHRWAWGAHGAVVLIGRAIWEGADGDECDTLRPREG